MKRGTVRRPRRKYRRRITRRRSQNKAEVKYFTFTGADFASNVASSPTTSTALFPEQHQISGMLSGIVQGTSRSQRVGSKIFVKFIRFHFFVRSCPSSDDYLVSSFLFRILVTNTGSARITAGTQINDFFGVSVKRNINGIIDRSNINVLYDRIHLVSSPTVTTTTTPYTMCGGVKAISFTVPINRTVDFVQNSSTVRNDRDYLSLSTICGVPGMSIFTNTKQVACFDVNYRVYYTDA